MAEEIKPDKVVDARGSFCPGPLMEMIKAYKQAKVGDVISVYSTDSGTKKDATAWINKSGNQLIGVFDRNGYYEIEMKKVK
ncbi:MAG: sulfurtransferase TusA family protein [Candidatus Thermoplasmatota archaeon]|nr:sulfurtransferase TusA family protein [Candidatus Thermoplasmatota archaeon]MCL5732986.1 sulfurtransferase TusA family protein [Candidatus Thermoplasmatota archaeon]WMT45169.1 MAG: sulfurtransferase TusA family protein [Cuniculiplasma divulgatum]